MKKLLLGVAVAVLGLSGSNASAGATDSCTISNTGPDSTNSCVVKDDFTCKVENNNKFTVINKNNQEAVSGDAKVSGNTTGGSATSGSATNSNGTVIDVSIDNSGACAVTAVTPPAPVVPVGGSGGGQPVGGQGAVQQPRPVGGMGAVAPVAAPQGGAGAAPTVLPETSTETTIGITAGLIALLATVVFGSRAALGAFSKLQS